MHRFQVFILVIIIPIAALMIIAERKNVSLRDLFVPTSPIIKLDDIPMSVEIVTTESERVRGLSGRKALPEFGGMLFVFDKADYHGVWMKGMRFPIDVIWISEDLKIVGITESLTPESYPKVYYPPTEIKYMLETNVKYADTWGISVGDRVTLPLELNEALSP
jgi:hypothetical protein